MENTSDKKLLFDPMFERYSSGKEHQEKHSLSKKIIFVITLSFFVGISMFLSFSTISGTGAEYEKNTDGYTLASYKSSEEDVILRAEYKTDENGAVDTSSQITVIAKYTLCCDEYIEYIYIGKHVREIETNAFYYCKNLKAIFVDKENEHYASVDGVLYKKENGNLTEIILYPMMHGYYTVALSSGLTEPQSYEATKEFSVEFNNNKDRIKKLYESAPKTYTILEGVTKISDLCFNSCFDIEIIDMPSSIREIGSMAFFRCESLKKLVLPDGLTKIGSDAFTKCISLSYVFIPSSVIEIGHHAFYDCSGLSQINLGHNDASSITVGENWIPQKREIFMKDIPTVYSQERSE